MIPLNSYRWRKKAPISLHAAGYRAIDTIWIVFSKILSITFLWLICQFPGYANAETSDVDYAVPPPIEIPNKSRGIKEPQGVLSLSEALSLAVTQPGARILRVGGQGERSADPSGRIVA